MPSISLYVPDALLEEVTALGVDRAQVCVAALREAVRQRRQTDWIAARLAAPIAPDVPTAEILAALDEVRDDAA